MTSRMIRSARGMKVLPKRNAAVEAKVFLAAHLFIYLQGACILNMLRDFMTPEAFEIGIIKYLKRYSYQNTVNSHLWESLTNVSNLCVCSFLWIGYLQVYTS